jgi:CheY-like chemotaxis protein
MNSIDTTSSAKIRILVVEDEVIIAMDIAMQLEDLGYEHIGHARSGEQAIVLTGQLRPDLVLMDVQLAGEMDGIAAAQAIRMKFDIPCVFLSAFKEGKTFERALIAKPAGYLAKPFDEYQLRDTLDLALGVP